MKRFQESGLQQALSEAGDGALVVGPERRVLFWNRAAERLLGYTPAEAVGRHACEILEGRHVEGGATCRPECQMAAAPEEGQASFDVPARTKWGEALTINVSTLTLPSRHSEGPLVVHLFRDASPAKSADRLEDDELPGAPSTLTPRELEVLHLLAAGANTRVASQRLGVSSATVRNHVQNLLGKLGVHSRLEAVAYATRRGLLTTAS